MGVVKLRFLTNGVTRNRTCVCPVTARDAHRLRQCEKLSHTQLSTSSHMMPQPPVTSMGVGVGEGGGEECGLWEGAAEGAGAGGWVF